MGDSLINDYIALYIVEKDIIFWEVYFICFNKNYNIFQTTRFNPIMIFFQLTDQYKFRDIYTNHHNCLGHMLITYVNYNYNNYVINIRPRQL